ncbi:hypothetical protein EVA_10474 [gut metagenome]|uniref:Uncharacterized protein n=1 Tax=gut metagenome TaxID=749906 RepID=J9G3K7_9ZZZZ
MDKRVKFPKQFPKQKIRFICEDSKYFRKKGLPVRAVSSEEASGAVQEGFLKVYSGHCSC